MNKKQAKLSSYWTGRPDPDEGDDDDVICLSSTINQNKTLKSKKPKSKSFGPTHSQVPSTSVQSKVSYSVIFSAFGSFFRPSLCMGSVCRG
jgi:hypothetical protein